jgi:tetratricopeptide (TPR) repeat protein
MIKRLLVITAILFLHTLSFASPYSKWWDKGNRFYKQKQYDSAAFYFEKIAAMKPQDAVVYYNLGNSYYRLNEITLAVLNYERALKINPSFQEAKDNLELTRNRIPGRIPETEDIFFLRWWKAINSPALTVVWAVLSLCLFLATISLSILKILGVIHFSTKRLQVALVCACGLCLIFAFGSTRSKLEEKAVVIQDAIQLMNGNKPDAKSIGNIPEGTTVEIKSESGTQTEIRLPDGRSGWVSRSSLVKI